MLIILTVVGALLAAVLLAWLVILAVFYFSHGMWPGIHTNSGVRT